MPCVVPMRVSFEAQRRQIVFASRIEAHQVMEVKGRNVFFVFAALPLLRLREKKKHEARASRRRHRACPLNHFARL